MNAESEKKIFTTEARRHGEEPEVFDSGDLWHFGNFGDFGNLLLTAPIRVDPR